jgi:hypothetical protein
VCRKQGEVDVGLNSKRRKELSDRRFDCCLLKIRWARRHPAGAELRQIAGKKVGGPFPSGTFRKTCPVQGAAPCER